MDPVSIIALTLGIGWASGINLYAAVLALGLMQNTGLIVLPPDLQILGAPVVIAAAGFMYLVEFFADKVPGVDSAWDVLHTFIRIPAGAILAAQAVGDVHPALALAAALIGGSLAATSHVTKASTRMLINTSPEPVSNWTASVLEDVAVIGGLWLTLQYPVLFLVLLVAFIALVVWLAPKLLRALGAIAAKVGGWFRRSPPALPDQPAP